jgi:flagellar motor switch protein FliM
MNKQHSSYNLVVGDLIKLNDDSNIIWEVQEMEYFRIYLKNTNKNDNRISRMITTIDYYRTEPIQRWQEQLEKIGFEYLSE